MGCNKDALTYKLVILDIEEDKLWPEMCSLRRFDDL